MAPGSQQELDSRPAPAAPDSPSPAADSAPAAADSAPAAPDSPSPAPGPRFPANRWERGLNLGVALVGALVLALSAWLRPDPRGMGTHEQLGLPACGVTQLVPGLPCPSCGFTTSFALAAHGQPGASLYNQPFGFLLFLATLAGVPLAAWAAWRGESLLDRTAHWPWRGLALVTLGLWLLAWGWKIWLQSR